MKKGLCFFLCVWLVLTLTACKNPLELPKATPNTGPASLPTLEDIVDSEPESLPPPEPLKEKPGYIIFESEQINFQYPEKYTEWSQRTKDDPAVAEAILAVLVGSDAEELATDLDNNLAIFYDLAAPTEGIVHMLTLRFQPNAPGASMEALDEAAVSDLRANMEVTYEGFSWIQETGLTQLGQNQYLVSVFDFSQGELTSTCYQALHAKNDTILTFSFTMPQGALDDAKTAEIEEQLTSAQFL